MTFEYILDFKEDRLLPKIYITRDHFYQKIVMSRLLQRHRNIWLVSSGVSLASWGEGASLALVGHPTSDGITIKIPYGVYVYVDQLRTPSFPIRLV